MKLKDYLHLYKDVNVQVKRKNDKDYHIGRVCEITSKSNHGDWVMVWFEDVIKTTSSNWETSTSNAHHFFLGEDEIKPILRRLHHAKREEIEHILWLVHDSKIHLDKDCRISKKEAAQSIDGIEPDDRAIVVYHTIRCAADMALYLSSHSGLIRLYDEEEKELPIEFKPELYQYLLSKHFDLFGLIDKELALDESEVSVNA